MTTETFGIVLFGAFMSRNELEALPEFLELHWNGRFDMLLTGAQLRATQSGVNVNVRIHQVAS